jgi:cyclic-di-GMP-binding protein
MFPQHLSPQAAGRPAHKMEPDQLEEWLAGLPSHQPLEATRALAQQLAHVRKADLAVRTRLKLMETMRDKAESLLPPIEERLNHATLPLPPALQQAVVAVNALLKELASGYAATAARMSGKWYGLGFQKPLRIAVTQGLRLNLRRLRLAYRVYAHGSRSAWTGLHRLYGIARAAGIAAAAANGAETPQRIYVEALLLAFAEPAKFAPGELDRVRLYIDRYGHLARLDAAATLGERREPAAFLIRPSEAASGRSLLKWGDRELQPGDLVLRCGALVEKVNAQIAGLERGTPPARLGLPKMAEQPQYAVMLHTLASLWGAPPLRSFRRLHFRPRVNAVVGFAALWSFIGGDAFRRRAQDGAPQAVPHGDLTEWTVINESPDGFALRYVSGNATGVKVGEILGLRPRGGSAVHVCVARRAESTVASLELGTQVLASRAVAATITLPGESAASAQNHLRVILLPRMPAIGNAPALLAPPAALDRGIEFALPLRGKRVMMRIARRIEQTPSCEVYALESAGAQMGAPHEDAPA